MNAWQKAVYSLIKQENGFVKVSHVTEESIAFEAKEFRIPNDPRLTKMCLNYDLIQWIGLNKNQKVSWVFATKTEE